jgi:hypothetical protein
MKLRYSLSNPDNIIIESENCEDRRLLAEFRDANLRRFVRFKLLEKACFIVQAMKQFDNKVAAIKLLLDLTGCKLTEGKMAVDYYWNV